MTDDIVARLRLNGGLDARLLCAAADEIERLRAERDEARPMYCEELSLRAFGDTSCAWEEASIRSWNCFEEVKP